jgi:hypothetical protein
MMRLEVSEEVRRLVAERGGRLFVWTKLHGRCCGSVRLLETGTDPPRTKGLSFRRIAAEGFDLFIDTGGRALPEKLVLEARGRSRTVHAYWNDQAWVG